MPAPVTQHDVALAAGVSRSTVTRALRDDPQISAAERARIHALAQKLGYRPNPLVTALMTQLRTGKPATFRGTLGYVVFGWDEAAWRANPDQRAMFEGAQNRATELGYRVELHVHEPARMSARRLSGLLVARGIQGLLLPAPSRHEIDPPLLQWPKFALATLGFRLGGPGLHFTANDHFASTWSLLHNLEGRGYRRPGLLLDTTVESLTSFRIEGAFAAFQSHHLAPADRLAPLLAPGLAPETVLAWARREKPDVVIANTPAPLASLRAAGVRVPAQTGFALLRVNQHEHPGVSGMNPRSDLVGSAGVDMVTAQINRSETGMPANQRGLLVESDWHEGATLRPRR